MAPLSGVIQVALQILQTDRLCCWFYIRGRWPWLISMQIVLVLSAKVFEILTIVFEFKKNSTVTYCSRNGVPVNPIISLWIFFNGTTFYWRNSPLETYLQWGQWIIKSNRDTVLGNRFCFLFSFFFPHFIHFHFYWDGGRNLIRPVGVLCKSIWLDL